MIMKWNANTHTHAFRFMQSNSDDRGWERILDVLILKSRMCVYVIEDIYLAIESKNSLK